MSTAAATSALRLSSLTPSSRSAIKWAAGGWTFFIGENFILSENRTYLISHLGDDNYHYLYGTISTAAVGSIAYGYVKKVRNAPPFLWRVGGPTPVGMRVAGFALQAVGLALLSQVPPKLQVPIHSVDVDVEGAGTGTERAAATTGRIGGGVGVGGSSSVVGPPAPPGAAGEGAGAGAASRWQVRCPFDFTDSKTHRAASASDDTNNPRGLERVSRHPGLWSFGLLGLGHACLVPSLPARIWWSMPALVALIGGAHTDSRFRRNMGGSLDEGWDERTSNVPFLAMVAGRQDGGGGAAEAFRNLAGEGKGLNAALAVGTAALLVLRRGR